MSNPTVGYSLGVVEGYLESLIAENLPGAMTVLEHFKMIEAAYIEAINTLTDYKNSVNNARNILNGQA